MVDELLPHTEPCATCDTGIEWMQCHDGIMRCRNCVHDLAVDEGWDEPPHPRQVEEEEEPSPPIVDDGVEDGDPAVRSVDGVLF